MSERLSDLRVAFIGIGTPFATASLRAVNWNCNLVGVIESINRNYGELDDPLRNHRSGMRGFASRRRIPWTFIAKKGPRLGEFLQRVRPDVICIAGMAQLIRPQEWQIASLGAINLHPTLLPRFRGPKPTFWQFHDMDLAGGVTIHQVDRGIDTGDILTQSRFAIPLGCRPLEFFHRSSIAGASALIRALSLLQNGKARPVAQRHLPCPRYARMTEKGEQFIDYDTWPSERIWHFLRGTHDETRCVPLPEGARGGWNIEHLRRHPGRHAPGTVYHDAEGHHVALRDGSIALRMMRPSLPRKALYAIGRRVEHLGRWW